MLQFKTITGFVCNSLLLHEDLGGLFAHPFVVKGNRTCPEGYLKCNNGQCINHGEYCSTGYTFCNDRTVLHESTTCRKYSCDTSKRRSGIDRHGLKWWILDGKLLSIVDDSTMHNEIRMTYLV